LLSDAAGEIEKDDGVLVIKRIHVRYRLRVDDGDRETAERVHAVHARACPVYRTISGCVEITTELLLEGM
jgi:uncharacterized OsmC-like protein